MRRLKFVIPSIALALIFSVSCSGAESGVVEEKAVVEETEEEMAELVEETIEEEVIEKEAEEEEIEEVAEEEAVEKPVQEPVKVYEDENVIIYFDSLSANGVVFKVENLTDVNITIQADSISVNKESINDIMMSDDVAPQSIGKVTAGCGVDSTTPVSTIGGQLRIIDFSDTLFDSYNATFVNVAVD